MKGDAEGGPSPSGVAETQAVDYAGRALMKSDRAAELFGSLEEAVDQWNDDRQLMAPARSPMDADPRLDFFRPAALDEIPWDSWESSFHDGVHNLRVALDSFCYDLCYLEASPTNPRDIYFPITKHPNEWPTRSRALATMPVELLERIRQCQPWARPDPQSPDPLTLISRIDNVDKHRATGVTLDVMPMGQWALRPIEPLPPELANSRDWTLTPWMSLTFESPLGHGIAALMPVMALPIVMFEGLCADLPDVQRWLHREVWRVISFIASGEWPESGGFERVLPEPTWWVLPDSPSQ